MFMLYTQPVNSNGYVSFLINTLNTIVSGGWIYAD